MKINITKRDFPIKIISLLSFFLNLVSIIFGIVYLTLGTIGISYIFLIWDIFAVVVFICWVFNFLLIFIITIGLDKKSKLKSRINLLSNIYLCLMPFAIFLIIWANYMISAIYSNEIINTISFYGLLFIGYFGIFTFGLLFAFIIFKTHKNKQLWEMKSNIQTTSSKNYSLLKKIFKIILKIICISTLLFGVLCIYGMFFGGIQLIAASIAAVSSLLSLFYAFIFLSTTIILMKMIYKEKNRIQYRSIAIIGLTIFGFMLLPVFSTSIYVNVAEQNFAAAYGADWADKIPDNIENTFFLSTHFSLAGYILGIPPKDCNIDRDIEYYNDGNISLSFDVYYLEEGGESLPGNNSVIIRIHGGDWRYGDKGGASIIQFNKYFAAQGYIIFDIQYGLLDNFNPYSIGELSQIPDNLRGNFTVDDMLGHIGNFTRELVDKYADTYHANLNSVFISGGSAGGHLSMASALGISSGNYTDTFSENLTIKGIIPLYPGDPDQRGVEGSDVFLDPEDYLIDENSPPCLIFQGTADPTMHETLHIKSKYDDAGNDEACIIWLPFAGHVFDIYFPGYYMQMLLYYMERFLYLCVENII